MEEQMIFFRIVDNTLYVAGDVNALGFEEAERLRIPDEYLDSKIFVIMRMCLGFGDWGIISAMPRLLKEKYPDCKVYVPTAKLQEEICGDIGDEWDSWKNPFENGVNVFKNNPHIDGFVNSVRGEIFHDHYRVYNKDNINIPLLEQILRFWQFEEDEYKDSAPELYFSDDEKELGEKIIKEYVGEKEFGCLLISNRFGTKFGKHNTESYQSETNKIKKVLSENKLPYFYWTYKPLEDTPFDFIDDVLDIRNVNLRVQMYIRCKAKLNVGNQSGTLQMATRYSDVYDAHRQSQLAGNFVRGEIAL